MKMTKILLAGLITISALSSLSAAEHEVKMLNNGAEGMMVFEPSVLKAAAGDTVKFIATDVGHNVSTDFVPEGAETWKSDAGKDITVTLGKDGTYIYKCDPHAVMAMVGVIKVGDVATSDAAKEVATKLSSTFVMNKDRLEKYMSSLDQEEGAEKETEKKEEEKK